MSEIDRYYYFFDLPIYLLKIERYEEQVEAAVERRLKKMFPQSERIREEHPTSCLDVEEDVRKEYRYPWQFNQIVGWLRLYVEGSNIGGHLWWVEQKRPQLRSRGTFSWVSHNNVLATNIKPTDRSNDIFAELLHCIEALGKNSDYEGSYVDLASFRRLGPFVAWRDLMDDAAKKLYPRSVRTPTDPEPSS